MNEKFKVLLLFLLLGIQAYAQSQKITGTVTDDKGQSLPGATVVLVGTKQGILTDLDGKFTLNASPGSQINISFIGFDDQTITVTNESVINVQMTTKTQLMSEIVVVGYGTQSKPSVVAAISQTSSEDIKKQGNVTNLTQALAGTMPGVTVLNTSGAPGGGGTGDNNKAEILIRGKNTWNDASPLILVDGIERNINDIEINDVENVSVLKDASATAVFGMKGGNGVILVTTKRGVSGKPKLSFEANSTFEMMSKYPNTVDAYSAMKARNYAILNEIDLSENMGFFINDYELERYQKQDMPYAYPYVNWQELLLKDFASSHRVNMNVSGGTNFVNYFGSLSYLNEGDLLNTQDIGRGYNPRFSYNRFNIRTNFDFKISKTTKLKTGIASMYGREQMPNSGQGTYYALYGHNPHSPVVQYEDGTFGMSAIPEQNSGNEFAELNSSGTKINNRLEINTDFSLEQKLDFITKGLSIKGKLAYDNFFGSSGPNITDGGFNAKYIKPDFYVKGGRYNYETKQYEMPTKDASGNLVYSPVDMVAKGYATYQNIKGAGGFGWTPSELGYSTEGVEEGQSKYTLYYEASINYERKFGKNDISLLGLFSRQKNESGSNWPDKREDWVARAQYNYDSKYLIDLNCAYNGSEQFGPDFRFDFFPSVGIGWNIANERFVKNIAPFIETFKIRYSFGLVGNDKVNADNWPHETIWSKGYLLGDNKGAEKGFGVYPTPTYSQYKEGTPGNPDLHWEKAQKQNLATEFSLFKGMITGTVDLFKEYRYEMLIAKNDRVQVHTVGIKASAANLGQVKSKGMEIESAFTKKFNNGLRFKIGGTWTISRSMVIEKDDYELKPFYQKAAGYPIGQIRIQQSTGLIDSWDDVYNTLVNVGSNTNRLPGNFINMDYNANGVIDTEDDKAPYGYPVNPLSTYTCNLSLDYKGWSLSALFYGTQNVTRRVEFNHFYYKSPITYQYILDATATPEYGNVNPTYPALSLEKGDGGYGTFNYYDGSLFRLKSIELSYTLPKKWTKTIGCSDARIYVNGKDLFVWTKMPADGDGRDRVTGEGESRNYPLKKYVTIGASVKF